MFAPAFTLNARSSMLMALILAGALRTGEAATPPPLAPPKPILTLGGHRAGIFKVAYSPGGKQLATTSADQTVRLWDAATGRTLHILRGHKGEVYGSAFSPDGRLLASAGSDGKVCLWDVARGKLVRTLEGPGNDLFAVAFSPDGRTVAAGSLEGRIRLWSAKQGRELHTLAGHANRVCGLAFSPNGERLVSACGQKEAGSGERGGEVKVWDAAGGDLLLTIPGGEIGILTVAFSPDGKRLAGACLDRTVRVWEAATGAEVLVLKGHKQEVYSAAFSPEGRWLASCGGDWNHNGAGEIKVWELATRREVASIQGHATPVWSVAFRPFGSRCRMHLVSASGRWRKNELRKNEPDEVKVWDLTALTVPGGAPVSPRRQEALWADLGDPDATKAYRAVWSLSASPKVALPLLKKHLRPPKSSIDYARIARLVADLDSDAFATREKASAELFRIGIATRPALRAATKSPSAEVRRRVAILLRRLRNQHEPPPSPEELRALRAIEVLQHLDSAEARPLLEKLAEGAPGSLVSREAAWVLAQKQTSR